MPFEYSDLPDLSGKTFIITGSTSGLGQAQARQLAKHNAHVIVVGRSSSKVQEVVESIRTDTSNPNVEGMIADLMDLKSVAKFCDSFLSKNIPLYSLTLNAASFNDKFESSKDGIEAQWQTNVLSQYFLCLKLLPALKKCQEARIVFVSSMLHSSPKSAFPLTNEFINGSATYSQYTRYGETKLANILVARYLSNQLKETGHENIFVNSLHPGVIASNFWKSTWAPIRFIASLFFKAPDNGAKTQTYLSASPEVALKKYRGEYFTPDAVLSQTSPLASDESFGRELIDCLESQLKSAVGQQK